MIDKPRPRAFRLDPAEPAPPGVPPVRIEEIPDFYAEEALAARLPAAEAAIETAQRRGMAARGFLSWGGLFWSALGGLITLALGLWVDRLVEDLFARTPVLGTVALVLAGLAVLALLVLAGRELRAVWNQRRVAELHRQLAEARLTDDREAARARVRDLAALYNGRPETAAARQRLLGLTREIIDGRDLIDIAERDLILPLDAQVRREIADAAKRVSVVTAISPRAIVDLVFVLGQAVRLLRRISEIYGGRPGFFGFVRLARSVGAHLAITGGMAAGDSLVGQVLGHGLASRLSARLGEGVLNGLLTARVGLSAMAVCRPMPFGSGRNPSVTEVAPFLFGKGAESRKDGDTKKAEP